jgi:hypothetical protein
MKLNTRYFIEGGVLDIVTKSVEVRPTTCKITSKRKQCAQNNARNMSEIFSYEIHVHNAVSRIEAQKSKKQNFFNKHKNK